MSGILRNGEWVEGEICWVSEETESSSLVNLRGRRVILFYFLVFFYVIMFCTRDGKK